MSNNITFPPYEETILFFHKHIHLAHIYVKYILTINYITIYFQLINQLIHQICCLLRARKLGKDLKIKSNEAYSYPRRTHYSMKEKDQT